MITKEEDLLNTIVNMGILSDVKKIVGKMVLKIKLNGVLSAFGIKNKLSLEKDKNEYILLLNKAYNLAFHVENSEKIENQKERINWEKVIEVFG